MIINKYNSNKNFYSFEQALDMRFRIPCKINDYSKNILSAIYIHENDFPLFMHSHNFYEINIVIDGTGTHYIENNSFTTQAGDVFVIPPNLSHGYSEDENSGLKILHILLSSRFMLNFSSILKGINGYSLLFNIEPQLRKNSNIKLFTSIRNSEFAYYLHEFKRLIAFCKDDMTDSVNETNKNVKVLNLICDLATTLTSQNISLSKETAVNINELLRVLSYIDNNFAEDITLAELCSIANMSRSSLLKQFTKLCKCSPSDYLLNTRLENACKMLEHTSYSIAQIAQDCGFYDSSHFSKAFFKSKNILPKDYRNSLKNI